MRDLLWWNQRHQNLRFQAKNLFNRSGVNKSGYWAIYKEAFNTYNTELKQSNLATFRQHCEDINCLPEAVWLQKALAKDNSSGICTLIKPRRDYIESPKETSRLLMEIHFPGGL